MQIEHKLHNIVYLIQTELETYKSLRCTLLQLDWCIDSVWQICIHRQWYYVEFRHFSDRSRGSL